MPTSRKRDSSPARAARGPVLADIADRVSWMLLIPVVLLATRIWLGPYWPLWAMLIVAALSARRELTRLFLSPLSPALRQALTDRPAEAATPLRELARRHGLRTPNVIFWPEADLPGETQAAYYLIQRMPIFLLGRRLPELLSPQELGAVFAHELSHHLLGHVKRTSVARVLADMAAVAAACAAIWRLPLALGSLWALAGWAAAVLLIWGAARACLQVALNAYARRQELQADRKAMEITADQAAFVSAYHKLADQCGAEAGRPGWAHFLLSDRPTLQQRLAAAEKFA
jgi:Zn-dependent protease with chaperone function